MFHHQIIPFNLRREDRIYNNKTVSVKAVLLRREFKGTLNKVLGRYSILTLALIASAVKVNRLLVKKNRAKSQLFGSSSGPQGRHMRSNFSV
jgi:hypothetical protein